MNDSQMIGSLVGIALIVGGALWRLSWQVSAMVTELKNIHELLAKGEERMERIEKRVNDHETRITVMEKK